MAVCSKCQKKIGMFKKAIRLGPDKARFCEACAEEWRQEEKKQNLTALFEGGAPAELFSIKKVMMVDPDDATHAQQFGGELIFTDKGICYAAVTRFKVPSQATATALFGLIGALVQASQAKAAKKKAWAKVPGGGEERPTDDLARFLYDARRLVVLHKRDLIRIQRRGVGLRIEARDRKPQMFILDNGKKTYKQYKSQIEDYLQQ